MGFPHYGPVTAVVLRPTGEPASQLDNGFLNFSPLGVRKSFDKDSLKVSPDSLDKTVADKIAYLQNPSSTSCGMNVEILKNNSTTVAGLPPKQLTYLKHGLGQLDMSTIVIKGDKEYQLQFTIPKLKVPETLPIVQQMINTFRQLNLLRSMN